LYFEYEDSKYFKNVLKALKAINIDEIVFVATPEGIMAREMDPSHVVLVDLSMPIEVFYEYDMEGKDKVLFPVDLDSMTKKIFKNVYKDEHVRIKIGEKDILVSLKARVERKFKMSLRKPEYTEIPTPAMNHTTKVIMILSDLITVLKDVEAETVQFLCDPEKDIFKVSSIEESSTYSSYEEINYEVTFDRYHESLLEIEIESDKPVQSKYAASWLKSIANALKPLEDVVQLQFASCQPLQITMALKMGGKITYYLAPRIEDPDEY